MKTAFYIAHNVFRESIRDRILYSIVLFGVLLIGGSLLLTDLSMRENQRMIIDIGLASITFCTIAITLFLGSSMLFKEIDRGSIQFIIAKPVRRSSFITGKWLGLTATAVIVASLMHGVLIGVMLAGGYAVPSGLGANLYSLSLELGLVAALTILLSAFTSPIIASTTTIIVTIVGHLMADVRAVVDAPSVLISAASKMISRAMMYLIPNLDTLNVHDQIQYGIPIPLGQLAWTTLYIGGYVISSLAVACILFEKKQL